MEIRLESLREGAERAEGTVVIIDVFRAFTTAAVAFQRGAERIIMTAEVEEALDLKRRGLGDLCMGEVGGLRPEGFDFGNSPHALSQANVKGLTLIQSTRAGTVGVSAARNSDRIYTGSLANAGATVNAINRDKPKVLTLVAMGDGGLARTDEDEQCALYMRNLLEGRTPDKEAVRTIVLASRWSEKFDEADLPHKHPGDRELALSIDSAPFAIGVDREDGLLIAQPQRV